MRWLLTLLVGLTAPLVLATPRPPARPLRLPDTLPVVGWSSAFSPDGKILAAAYGETDVKLWDLTTGKGIATLDGHIDWVRFTAFGPDGKTLASGGDNMIKLWDVKTRKEIASLEGTGLWRFYSVAFSPDGRTLVAGYGDDSILAWDVKTRKKIGTVKVPGSITTAFLFSRNGKTLASVTGWIRLWDVKSGAITTTIETGSYSAVAVHPDLTMAASGGYFGIHLWDLKKGKKIGTLGGERDRVYSLAFSPDGKMLAAGGDEETIRIWDIKTGQAITTIKGEAVKEDEGSREVSWVAFTPDGKALAATTLLGIKFWDLKKVRKR